MSDFERFLAFERGRLEPLATRTERFEHGVARFRDDAPLSYDLNALAVDRDARPEAAALAAAADRIQGAAGLLHRKVAVDGPDGRRLAAGFRALGWRVVELAVLVHDGRELAGGPAEEVGPAEVEPLWVEGMRRDLEPDGEVIRQLLAARHARRETVAVRYFAARAGGRVAASCELLSAGALGQVESVATLEEHRGRGLGTAVVVAATNASRAAGHERTFLVADAGGWPLGWYERLGYRRIGELWDFVRTPEPLRRLRLRTPRLELRLPTDAELAALAEVARRGVHPPDELPFRVAWTAGSDEPGFVERVAAYHRGRLAAWSPDDWRLELVAFLDGSPVGSQGVHGRDFAQTRTATTGSWLGLPFQGRGLGTEMRAAVLELLFRGLGAAAAESAAFAGNPQSIRVSEKLGYRRVGEVVEPRPELRFRLDRSDRRSPVPVEIEALEAALPLFGVTSGRSRRSGPAGRAA